jgi:hypothetical protein
MNSNPVEHREIITGTRGGHHIAVWHDPHPIRPVNQSVTVPEGGSTILFILAAFTAIAWASMKRYRAHSSENVLPAQTSF